MPGRPKALFLFTLFNRLHQSALLDRSVDALPLVGIMHVLTWNVSDLGARYPSAHNDVAMSDQVHFTTILFVRGPNEVGVDIYCSWLLLIPSDRTYPFL